MSEWQPIETVPRGGLVLIYGGRGAYSLGEYSEVHSEIAGEPRFNVAGFGYNVPATHWTPLPEPPSPPKPRRFAVLVHTPRGLASLEAARGTSVFLDTPENRAYCAKEGETWLTFDLVERE